MHVIEIFLPVESGDGTSVGKDRLDVLTAELAERFGGATAFTRSPADGLWKDGGEVEHDSIVIVEVMTDTVDAAWWREYRTRLEREFKQSEVLIRATQIDRL